MKTFTEKEKQDSLLFVASLQLMLDVFEELKGSMVYQKKIKFHGNHLLKEFERLENIVINNGGEEQRSEAIRQWVNVSQLTENFMRKVFETDIEHFEALDEDLEKVFAKYNEKELSLHSS